MTFGNDCSKCSVGENTIRSEKRDAFLIESSNVLILYSVSYSDKSVTWTDFVVSADNDGLIKYVRMSSQAGTAKGLVGASKSKILIQLENGTVWQPSGKV